MMKIKADTPAQYVQQLPEDRKEPFQLLRKAILDHLPEGFEETINYGMIGYVVPHSAYPEGYHSNPEQPLPFMNLASQKNYIALYHLGLYSNRDLMDWFTNAYPKHSKRKLDMGKSCIRFKEMEHIPYKLIGELTGKISVDEWIHMYETKIKR